MGHIPSHASTTPTTITATVTTSVILINTGSGSHRILTSTITFTMAGMWHHRLRTHQPASTSMRRNQVDSPLSYHTAASCDQS
eukprot:m.56494 g.56494  ORF g.56494 m.56494 type:complete len:83 (-) comp7684_c0_seq1:385-633(-)